MKKTSATPLWIMVILVILVIFGGVYFITRPSIMSDMTPVNANGNSIVYSCDSGKGITAVYENASVMLNLSDGRIITLPQVMSGSGIRFEQGAGTAADITFESRGDNAFLTENGITTYNNCIGGSTSIPKAGMKTFIDQSTTFSFSYPELLSVSGGDVGYTQEWMNNATTTGLVLAKVVIPQSFEPKTNFSDATFTVGTSPDPTAIAQCLSGSQGNPIALSTVTINGLQYAKFVSGDAGAGNFYETTSYRTLRNSQCYAVEYTIHSTNIGNYSPDQGISEFDKAKVEQVLEQMVQSFKFLQASS